MHHIDKYYSISYFQTIPEEADIPDGDNDQVVKTTKRIPREADFLTYSCDSYCLRRKEDKAQSGGDFVSHFAKNENCLADFILFEMLPQQNFVFYPVIIFQIDFHYYKGMVYGHYKTIYITFFHNKIYNTM